MIKHQDGRKHGHHQIEKGIMYACKQKRSDWSLVYGDVKLWRLMLIRMSLLDRINPLLALNGRSFLH